MASRRGYAWPRCRRDRSQWGGSSGRDFSEAWFTGATMREVRLAGAELYRADMQGADLRGADLTSASLVRVNLDDAVLIGAVLDGADLVKASLYGVDATDARCRGTRFQGSSLLNVDFRGADLTDAVVVENSFKVRVDSRTVVKGLTGSVFGPVEFVTDAGFREIAGQELARWIAERGGRVRVLS
ncbi:pentapeptide repeat-containing protein [Streptomyces uncialis]|uniref:pentapeptide repeat-containing protein n=1 Tax=Streptomyces uncialis TaxID=1048205 RepID=UPI0038651175|nr:pentapeptide repeat-containing protein [Streptomyces uncialis]